MSPRHWRTEPAKFKKCPSCGFKVWLTQRAEPCKHLQLEDVHEEGFATLAAGVDANEPMCVGWTP